MGLPDQTQNMKILLVSAMLTLRYLEANAGTTEQEMTVLTPEQLGRVGLSKRLDLFRTTCKVPKITEAMERLRARQRLMPRFRALMTGSLKKAFLAHRNAVTTAEKRVAGMSCSTEQKKKEVL